MHLMTSVSTQSMLLMMREQKKSRFMESRIPKWLLHRHFAKSYISNLVQF